MSRRPQYVVKQLGKILSGTFLSVSLAGFLLLAALNLGTYFANPSSLLSHFGDSLWGAILANFVFDSWGTLAGLLGAVLLFAPILFGEPPKRRKSLSTFFVIASVAVGVGSSLLWNYLFRNGGGISYGSSAIDIAAQSIIFTFSIYALMRSFSKKQNGAQTDSYIRNSFRIIYVTLIATTLWFILQLEPIFVPSDQFNWRVHEIAFLSGIVLTAAFIAALNFLPASSGKTKEETGSLASENSIGQDPTING